ncbi:O-antigen ligase family protein [Alteromonas macleodii]|uniref:O-antigen ligase family protein n=1 Tax=Alteromonas macleodii TaxID=28108 RepID=UPI0030D59640
MFEGLKVVVGLISFIMVYRTITGNCNKYLAFAICAIWLRFFLAAFHTITYPSLVAGFSINALSSISIAALGLFFLPLKVFALRKLAPFYFLFLTIFVSGFINLKIPGTINVLVKWCYFLVLAGAIFLSVRVQGHSETFKKLLVCFFMPVTLQVLSIALGEVKATENDGSASYIGGYNHEAAFSMIIVSFIFVLGLTERYAVKFRTTLFTVAVFLLILVNYRTAVLTILPIAAIFYYSLVEQRLKPSQKAPVLTIVSMLLIFVFVAISFTLRERFADVGTLASNLDLIFKSPIYFSEAEKDIMSSRVYLWSQYINALTNSDLLRQMIGFGPDSWKGVFKHYAHNTYVSYFYEYGYIGLMSFLLLCLYALFLTANVSDKRLAKILPLSLIGFLTMNLATMPLWNIEGLIFFAILIGVSLGNTKPSKTHLSFRTQLALLTTRD